MPDSPVPLSMRKLAALLGTSRSTVSRAFRDDASVSPELRARIRKAAAAQGYRPDPMVTELMTSFAQRRPVNYRETLGVLWWPDRWSQSAVAGSFAARLRAGLDAAAVRHGCKVSHFVVGRVSDAALGRTLRARGIQGVVITPPTAPDTPAPALDWTRLSVMVVGRSLPEASWNRVHQDHYAALVEVLHRLRARGFRRPVLLAQRNLEERMQRAYTAAFLAHEAGPPSHVIHAESRDALILARCLRGLDPDVLIADTEQWEAAVRALPGDFATRVGFVCLDVDAAAGPVSGIFQNASRMAEGAIDLLMQARLRHETGLLDEPLAVLTPGRWIEGVTLDGLGPSPGAA